jgi:hypothetical protein
MTPILQSMRILAVFFFACSTFALKIVTAGDYCVYGSQDWFNIPEDLGLHFSNILINFREGKAIAICDAGSDYDWRQKLTQFISDLPVAPPEKP